MNESNLQNIGATLLRVSLGIVLIAHSAWLKVMVFGIPGTVGFFESLGLPGFSAYLTIAVEIIAGLALIVGYQVRLAALASVSVLIGASWVHSGNGWLFSNANGGWEYPVFLVAVALAVFFIGGGKTTRNDVVNRFVEPAESAT